MELKLGKSNYFLLFIINILINVVSANQKCNQTGLDSFKKIYQADTSKEELTPELFEHLHDFYKICANELQDKESYEIQGAIHQIVFQSTLAQAILQDSLESTSLSTISKIDADPLYQTQEIIENNIKINKISVEKNGFRVVSMTLSDNDHDLDSAYWSQRSRDIEFIMQKEDQKWKIWDVINDFDGQKFSFRKLMLSDSVP